MRVNSNNHTRAIIQEKTNWESVFFLIFLEISFLFGYKAYIFKLKINSMKEFLIWTKNYTNVLFEIQNSNLSNGSYWREIEKNIFLFKSIRIAQTLNKG